MDKATIVGIIFGIFFLMLAILAGGSVATFINIPSLSVTFGGTLGSLFIHYSWEQVLSVGKVVKNAFTEKSNDPSEIINSIIHFSEKARREGLLALEKDLNDDIDPYLQKGIQMVIDGSDEVMIAALLDIEKESLVERHKLGANLFVDLAAYAPAWGMIGTIIGLILMLKNLDDPAAVGPSMAVALLTTFYGALGAFFMFTPIAGKLKVRSQQEQYILDIIATGILSIQAGDNPRMVTEKLKSFLAPSAREQFAKDG
jgi:chemotaxis protein MotA